MGLCLLLDTEWNRCRSDVKWLEYAGHRVASLCADLQPYADVRDGETGLLYHHPDQLAAHLDMLLGDEALRRRIADRASEEARTERLERRHAPDRLAFYCEAAAALPGIPLLPPLIRRSRGQASGSGRPMTSPARATDVRPAEKWKG